MENMTGSNSNPSPIMDGSLIGVKNAMTSLALDITREGMYHIRFIFNRIPMPNVGGKNVPFFVYCMPPPGDHMLVMEIVAVKQAAWPEPSEKVREDPSYKSFIVTHIPNTGMEVYQSLPRDQIWAPSRWWAPVIAFVATC